MRVTMCVDWGGRVCTEPEVAVLQNVAVRMMRMSDKPEKIYFSHDLCEGLMTCKGDGLLGATAGTHFEVDFGSLKGARWFFNFLLIRGSELVDEVDEGTTTMFRFDPTGSSEIASIDAALVKIREHVSTGRGIYRLN